MFKGRQGEPVEDVNWSERAQPFFINFHLKMLALRHGMGRSPFFKNTVMQKSEGRNASQLQAGQIALFFLWNLLPGALGCSCPISVFLATTETTRAQFSWFPHRREEKGIRSITSWPTSAISSFPPSCTALSSPRSVFWLLWCQISRSRNIFCWKSWREPSELSGTVLRSSSSMSQALHSAAIIHIWEVTFNLPCKHWYFLAADIDR